MKMEIVEQRILTADKGMYLTDGEDYVENVVLPVNADHSVWKEVAEEDLPKDEEM
jgi:hypothetical protein